MDKKKQIEEMARIIAFDLCPNRHVHAKWGEESQCYSDNNFAECTKIKNVVDKLYNAGYRKIPENEVVRQIEESEMEDWLDGYKKGFKEGVQAVQIQAREQANYTVVNTRCVSVDRIDEICKELTEE